MILSKVYYSVEPNTGRYSLADTSGFKEMDYANSKGLSRKHIFDAVEASVKRLGTYLDVFQIHRLDEETPKKEIMRTLNDVVDQGLARYIGASSMRAVDFAQLQFIAEQNGWHKFISMQNYYNLIYREEEREMIPFCETNYLSKVGIIPGLHLLEGFWPVHLALFPKLREKLDQERFKILGLDALSEADQEIIQRVEKVAKDHNVSMAVVATAWVIGKGFNQLLDFPLLKELMIFCKH